MKNPPHTYLQKLRSYLDPAVTRKVSALTNMLSCSSGRSTTAAFPSPLTLYLSSRISLQLRKDCAQSFWSRQLGNFSYKTAQQCEWVCDKGDSCLSGTPRFEEHLLSWSVIKQESLNPYQSLVMLFCGWQYALVLTSLWGRGTENQKRE